MLLYVKDLEFISSEADVKLAQPPQGQTELPTCPVCLERLDEHISGVVTTVSVSAPLPTKASISHPSQLWLAFLEPQCVTWHYDAGVQPSLPQ